MSLQSSDLTNAIPPIKISGLSYMQHASGRLLKRSYSFLFINHSLRSFLALSLSLSLYIHLRR